MSRSARDFRDLSVAERIRLVEDIWESIAEQGSPPLELAEAHREELRRRAHASEFDPPDPLSLDETDPDSPPRKH